MDPSPPASAAPRVSVLMPTYRQAHFIRRALDSLLAQTLVDWEALIVDDGSGDDTDDMVRPYLLDPRIRYRRLGHDTGLGNARNEGMAQARAPLLAYLPSDDVYYRGHLQSLLAQLAAAPEAVLAFSGVRYHYNRYDDGCIPGRPLQLVQCMHRRTPLRWIARAELESVDLDRLYWSRLRALGAFAGTGAVTCEWVSHPGQRHKIMQELLGGINPFRAYYGVQQPLRFHTSVGNASDEVGRYRHLRERPSRPPDPRGLKILIVGELAYNADRVLALEELGHSLYGLWMPAIGTAVGVGRPGAYGCAGPANRAASPVGGDAGRAGDPPAFLRRLHAWPVAGMD